MSSSVKVFDLLILVTYIEVSSEPCQTYKLECFVEIVNLFHLLTIFTKSSIVDVWHGCECISGILVTMITLTNLENLEMICSYGSND